MGDKRPSRSVRVFLVFSTILIFAFGLLLLLMPETQDSVFLQISTGIFLALGVIELLAFLVVKS